jgi:NADPH:quinone reductase-like Zn-dependent oxidoreductase
MKAITYRNYGPPEVLKLEELPKPSPKKNEILIRIQATAVNSADWRIRKPDPPIARLFFGLTKPRNPILGGVLAGVIEAVGSKVTRFKPGDRVFGSTGMSFGAYAEYKCLPETAILSIIPAKLSEGEAAAIPFGALTALHFLQKCDLQKGQQILVYGATGSVGTSAVQLAKNFGAHVTAACGKSNHELARSIGADKVIDYDEESLSNSFDVIFETVGKSDFNKNIKLLSKNGIMLLGSATLAETLKGIWSSLTSDKKIISGIISETNENLQYLTELAIAGKFRAVIDKTYPLEQIVAAHTYVEAGHKIGNVVIEIT